MGLLDSLKKKVGGSSRKGSSAQPQTAGCNTPATGQGAAGAAGPGAPPSPKEPVTKGAYLTFDGASNGTLFIVWSATPVEGAMAFFEPKKAVAEFKYKDKGGKSEIVRNLMQDKAKYYDGWCQFFKAAAEQHGVCRLLPGAEEAPLKVEVAFLDGTKVLRLENGKELPAKNMAAIGCVPRGDPGFQAQTLAKDVFLRNARRGGGAITL
ncbi:uncharacterized protein LOC34620672 [Cyclospora cayetanensis]|uniref:Uncharacterized protein LOC34620672 n=1 Tax=Cyclospora cayetanensis TaxID=88456 RepID=A0A6P5WD49_9EIME|nr:uncharacterized protein LOC34620672 [Cyclospora cayetanensis]